MCGFLFASERILCGIGADIETANDEECVPLHWAARHGDEVVVRVLLDAGELWTMALEDS